MTAIRARVAGCAAVALAALTAGCGNFYEHVGQSDWRAVGMNEPPVSAVRGEFEVTTLREGSGRVVGAGDLVYVRLLVTTPRINPPGIAPKPWPVDAWLWTGRGPEPPADWGTSVPFGDLGSARVRASLIGRAVGERFSIRLPDDAERSSDQLPLYALSASFDSGTVSSAWPTFELSSLGYGLASAEVEIVESCSARLLRREAVLRQWGSVFNLFGAHYNHVRRGVLGWTALEAECAALGRNFRFEIGPLYRVPGGTPRGDQLNDWSASYAVASAFQWGYVDVRYVAALLMAGLGFAMGRSGVRKTSRAS